MDKDKEIKMGHEGRLAVKKGLDRAADAVAPTLGPVGMGAIIEFPGLDPLEADDGVTILKNLKFHDKHEQIGLQKIRKAALRTSAEGGDGTATTTVLTQALVSEAFKEVGEDSSRTREVRERLQAGLQEVLGELVKEKHEVKEEDIEKIATISSLDPEIAKVIAETIKEVGTHGVITVEKGRELGFTREVVKGAKFGKGYISEYFINEYEKKTSVLIDPFIMLVDRKISIGEQVKPVMDAVAAFGHKSVLIIADDVDGRALASLIQSSKSVTVMDPATKTTKSGTYEVCAVRNPFNASPARDFLGDIAALTGAKVISEEAGMRLEDADFKHLGRAGKVIVTRDSCMIIDGKGDQKELDNRVSGIEFAISTNTSEYERAMLTERMAQLKGGIGVIRLGTYTDTDFNSKKYKLDNAISACQAALAEGVLPGGGIALMTAAAKVKEPMFKAALQAPFRQMAKNAGVFADGWALQKDEGVDFKAKKAVNMFEAGIIDPFKVVKLALESAVNIASTLVDKEVFITTIDEQKQ